MKLISVLRLVFATIITSAQPAHQYKVNAVYTDALIDVGDLDTFWSVYNRMYNVADATGGLSDVSGVAFNLNCNSGYWKPQITTHVKLDGLWGKMGPLNGWQVRDTMIHSMWHIVLSLGRRQSYPVYNQCTGFTWQEGVAGSRDAACGPNAPVRCPTYGRCRGAGALECKTFKWGHKIPSTIRVTIANNAGEVQTGWYRVDFSSASNGNQGGGCGMAGAIGEVLASFIPGVGSFFERGVKIGCRPGGI